MHKLCSRCCTPAVWYILYLLSRWYVGMSVNGCCLGILGVWVKFFTFHATDRCCLWGQKLVTKTSANGAPAPAVPCAFVIIPHSGLCSRPALTDIEISSYHFEFLARSCQQDQRKHLSLPSSVSPRAPFPPSKPALC